MADHSAMKLGKRAPRRDARTLRLAKYLAPALMPPAPDEVDWTWRVQYLGMLLNDELGDCGPAMALHQLQGWTAENGVELVPDDEDVLALYRAVGNYVDGDPSTDNGIVMLDLMNYWRRSGIAGGKKIEGYVALDLKNREHFMQAIDLFGSVSLGLALPLSAQNQDDWSLAMGGGDGDPTPGSWGGHAVASAKYSRSAGGLWIWTWGASKFLTWDWLDVYADEAYAPLSDDWADADGAPSGFDLAQLRVDLQAVAA